MLNRRETVRLFQSRLADLIQRSGMSRSAFAERSGLDRSTLSQLLAPQNSRLPRAETLAAIAAREQVSLDWLLGLSQEDHLGAAIQTTSLEIAAGGGTPADERLINWHAEAAGYKVRYVPTTLPDLLKTQAVVSFEYEGQGHRVRDTQLDQSAARLAYTRRPETDIEACSSLQSLQSFARGEGIWQRLPAAPRAEQLRSMITLSEELYPTFRWFLFDGLERYSVPYTVFGPTRAAVFLGGLYFVFNANEHIHVLARHFDDLIRAAIVQPPDVTKVLAALLAELESSDRNDRDERLRDGG